MVFRLIKTVRLRDLPPRPYLEVDEDLNLRAGVEWVPHGEAEAALGIEAEYKLSAEQAERLMSRWKRWRRRWRWID